MPSRFLYVLAYNVTRPSSLVGSPWTRRYSYLQAVARASPLKSNNFIPISGRNIRNVRYDYKHNVLPAYPTFFPNSGLLSIGALIPQKLFAEVAGKKLLSLEKLNIFLGKHTHP